MTLDVAVVGSHCKDYPGNGGTLLGSVRHCGRRNRRSNQRRSGDVVEDISGIVEGQEGGKRLLGGAHQDSRRKLSFCIKMIDTCGGEFAAVLELYPHLQHSNHQPAHAPYLRSLGRVNPESAAFSWNAPLIHIGRLCLGQIGQSSKMVGVFCTSVQTVY